MIKNVGSADRVIRVLLAVVLALLVITGSVEGTLAWILGIVAAALLVTGTVSFCPVYGLLKLSTSKKQ
jgi:hypothetical protein